MRTPARLAALGLLGVALGLAACTSVKDWDKQVKAQPAGVGIQGAAVVTGLVNVLRSYAATEKQTAAAQTKAEEIVAKLDERDRKLVEANPIIAVPVPADERVAPDAGASVVLFDVKSRRIVGNEVYDLKIDREALSASAREKPEVPVEIGRFKVQSFSIARL